MNDYSLYLSNPHFGSQSSIGYENRQANIYFSSILQQYLPSVYHLFS